MLLLTKEDIKKVFSMKEAIEADKQAFSMYSQGKSTVPLRVNINVPKYQGQTLYMPAYVDDLDSGGVKIVSVFPGNIEKGMTSVQATMVLVNEETGEVCSILDGTYLTQLRTGAAQGAATDILARKDSKVGALFGTGGQAATQLEAMLTARNLERVYVFDINKKRAAEFAAKMQSELACYGAEIVANEDVEEVLPLADVITAVTTSKRPVFDGRLVKEGAHVNGVGAYTPDMQELDEYIVKRADRVYVDSKEAVLAEAGDFIIPMKKGIIDRDRINGELGEVIAGIVPGRQSEKEITLFKTVGIAVQDVVTAHKIYKKALEQGVGRQIQF
ncbi:MAG TPA: ornithine cyclodeaminase family protein [Thermoanaerobacterales bacterium]|nr:ornithine cyclodeaminase family protein [Thermoanaerobacterales bacterium]